jgi:hypothetical protein
MAPYCPITFFSKAATVASVGQIAIKRALLSKPPNWLARALAIYLPACSTGRHQGGYDKPDISDGRSRVKNLSLDVLTQRH